MSFRSGNELEFANTKQTARVTGSKINKTWEMPEGWRDGPGMGSGLEEIAPAGSALVCLQPDTTLDLSPSTCVTRTYIQAFKRTEELLESLVQKSPEELQDLMGLGKKMAKSHLDRFKGFEKLPPKQACLLFGGKALRADDWSEKDEKFAGTHLRLVSGLYGVLRPYDDVKPVRDVPMVGRIKTKRGSSILEFWGDIITKQLIKDIEGTKRKGRLLLVGCLSDEYWKAIQIPLLPKNVEAVHIAFEGANDEETRRGRSLFARYAVRKKVEDADGLRGFDHDDWAIDARKSMPTRIIFRWDGDPKGAAKEKKKEKKQKRERGSSQSGSPVRSPVSDGGIVPGVIEGGSDSDAPPQRPPPKSKKERGGRSRDDGGFKPGVDSGSESDPPPEKSSRGKARAGGRGNRSPDDGGVKPGVCAGSDSDVPVEKPRRGKAKADDRSRSRRAGGGSRRTQPDDSREPPPRSRQGSGRAPSPDDGRRHRRRQDDTRESSPPPRSRRRS